MKLSILMVSFFLMIHSSVLLLEVSSFVPKPALGVISDERRRSINRLSPLPLALRPTDEGGDNNKNYRLQKDIDRESVRNAKEGPGEAVAGAVLGGLILGPFGALFGAQIGSSVGANIAVDRARKEEMEKRGITQEMLEMARESGVAIERAAEALRVTQESLGSQQELARRLDQETQDLYDRAKKAMVESDEDNARDLLFKRDNMKKKLVEVLKQCAEAKQRVEKMESNVAVLELRAKEVEALLARAVGAKSMQDVPTSDFSLTAEDPLMRKFRDMGID